MALDLHFEECLTPAAAAAGHVVGYEIAFNISYLRRPGYAMLDMMIRG